MGDAAARLMEGLSIFAAAGQKQAETIAFLSDAKSYGLDGIVERIDTHAAIVFLAGDQVYKLKRAVTFSYLDYGTVALRQRACESELALNKRTAPAIYIAVRSINRLCDGKLTFENDGEPIDWVVVMRRFSQQGLFDRLADRHQLTQLVLRQLTDRIVAFHAEAEPIPDHGGAAAMRAVIDGNAQSMAFFPTVIPADLADQLHDLSQKALVKIGSLLDERRASGHVRHCHGDLHLRNICLINNIPTLFDCIEFSDEIACIDELYDLSFLIMDLWQRDLKGEANLVFNRYLDVTEQGEGIAAIPLFLSARASIRAHVAAAASTTQKTADGRWRQEASARHHLLRAFDFLVPRTPCLIAVGGLSGTGKSTLAHALAPLLGNPPGARVLRSDVIRKRMNSLPPESRLPTSAYSRRESEKTYAKLYGDVSAALAAGSAVIVDAVFADIKERSEIARVAHRAGVAFYGLWLYAAAEVLEPRLNQRTDDASDATVDVLHRQMRYQIGRLTDWRCIDAGGEAELTLERARLALGQALIGDVKSVVG
jgi:uncharacterized protein